MITDLEIFVNFPLVLIGLQKRGVFDNETSIKRKISRSRILEFPKVQSSNFFSNSITILGNSFSSNINSWNNNLNCGRIERFMEKFSTHFKGRIAEVAFKKEYEGYGFEVIPLHVPNNESLARGDINMVLNTEGIKNSLSKILTSTDKEKFIEKIISDLCFIKDYGGLLPDYLLVKSPKEIFFYEIKNNTSKTRLISNKNQKRGIDMLREKGYKVYIKNKHIPLDTKTEFYKKIIEEIKIETLQNRNSLLQNKIKMLEKEYEERLKDKEKEFFNLKKSYKEVVEYYEKRIDSLSKEGSESDCLKNIILDLREKNDCLKKELDEKTAKYEEITKLKKTNNLKRLSSTLSKLFKKL